MEIPAATLDRTVTPSSTNPMGVKGIGEAGTIPAPPAVLNAVADALAPLGVTGLQMPVSPQRVWRGIQDASGEEGGQARVPRSSTTRSAAPWAAPPPFSTDTGREPNCSPAAAP